jgi:hypothetical protein
MKSLFIIITFVCIPFVSQFSAAQEGPVEIVAKGCKTELESFCKDVTPGDGRLLACLFAYNDKLSASCEYALYDASAQLERFVAALTYVANECEDNLESYCANVKPGEGRLLACLDKNKDKLSSRCIQALGDVGHK